MSWVLYKIRRKSDGLFSTGGSTPNWSKKGKTWTALGHITNHLNLVGDWVDNRNKPRRRGSGYGMITAPPPTRTPHPYEDAEIVRYTTTEDNVEDVPDYLKLKAAARELEKQKAEKKKQEGMKQQKLEQLRELQEWAESEGIETKS